MSDINPGFVTTPQSAAGYPLGATPSFNSSGNVANATANATFVAVAARLIYLVGFVVTATGSTGVLVVNGTITGLINTTFNFTFVFPAGITTPATPLSVFFGFPGMPASAVNQAVQVSLPAGGAGNTNATVNAWGYYI